MNRQQMLRLLTEGKSPLEVSIMNWEEIVANDGKRVDGIKSGESDTDHCALCNIYFIPFDNALNQAQRCMGCPVFQVTGQTGCQGTPYAKWTKNNTKENAQAVLDFLKSLQPAMQVIPVTTAKKPAPCLGDFCQERPHLKGQIRDCMFEEDWLCDGCFDRVARLNPFDSKNFAAFWRLQK